VRAIRVDYRLSQRALRQPISIAAFIVVTSQKGTKTALAV
jgi:hypothetical protein